MSIRSGVMGGDRTADALPLADVVAVTVAVSGSRGVRRSREGMSRAGPERDSAWPDRRPAPPGTGLPTPGDPDHVGYIKAGPNRLTSRAGLPRVRATSTSEKGPGDE